MMTRLETLIDLALSSADPGEIAVIAREVIASEHRSAIYRFAREVPGANTTALHHMLIDAGVEMGTVITMVTLSGDADIDEIQQRIIDSQDAEAIYLFARHVPGADIVALQAGVITSGASDPRVLMGFARDIGGADIARLTEAIIEVGDEIDLVEFAEHVTCIEEMSALTEAVIAKGSIGALDAMSEVYGADVSRLQQARIAMMRRLPSEETGEVSSRS